MKTNGRIILLLCALISSVAFCQVSPLETYDLAKAPRFTPGDVVRRICTQTYRSSTIDKEGETLRQILTVIDSTETQEVMAVDEAGCVTTFRDRLVSARTETTSKGLAQPVEKTTVELFDVFCLANRFGRRFQAETATIASKTVKSLTASRLALLKRFFNDRMDFHAFQQANTLLMPRQAVHVGQKWAPETSRMLQWLADNSATQGVKIGQPTGSFVLESVKDGLAVVRGSIAFGCQLGRRPARAKINISCRIDTDSGRWLSKSLSSSLTAEANDVVFQVRAIAASTMILQASLPPGSMSRSAHLYELGWPKPSEDTNRYRSEAHGLSLDVPDEYRPKKVDDSGPIVAAFAADNDRSITITLKDAGRPMDIDDLAPRVLGNLKRSTPGYITLESCPLTLPSNVPAMMIVGEAYDGSLAIVGLFAIDGRRLVSVLASAPGGQEKYVAEMKRILQTLRLFEPDLSAAD